MHSIVTRAVPLALLLAAAPAAAQQTAGKSSAPPDSKSSELELRFEREYYVYPARAGRDPFASLASSSDLGPRFEELTLQGVIYSDNGRSVALLTDRSGRIFRIRRGEMVGNARVLSIAQRKVLFAVDNFGIVRQEELELKRKDDGGGRP